MRLSCLWSSVVGPVTPAFRAARGHYGGMTNSLHLTGEPDADAVLAKGPFALLVGMLLDQRVRES